MVAGIDGEGDEDFVVVGMRSSLGRRFHMRGAVQSRFRLSLHSIARKAQHRR